MVCFCDIPLSRVDEHVDFYGSFGIGVTKEWAKSNGLSPVIYINENTKQHQALKKLLEENLKGKQYYNGADVDINTIMTHIKPTEGNMFIDGQFIPKEFYQENEWRYSVTGDYKALKIKPFLTESVYGNVNALESENSNAKEFYSLRVSPSDIKYLFVKSDSDIPDLVNFIQTELDHYPSADIKILLSRVTSLETISRDM
ncbi:hypothetical protein TUM4249_40270 [Shewanella sp. KT0246]|nr:hypothetical protein TUM4249_40270 [Shewanella sp. KT0246]